MGHCLDKCGPYCLIIAWLCKGIFVIVIYHGMQGCQEHNGRNPVSKGLEEIN